MSPFFEALLKKITKKNATQNKTNASQVAEEILNPLYQQPIEKKESLLRPKLPGVKSIKKNLVLILLILFGAIFIISFMYSMKKKDVPAVANQNVTSAMTSSESDTKLSYSNMLKNNNNGKPINGNAYGANGMNPNNGQGYQTDPYAGNRTAYLPNDNARYTNQRPVMNVSPVSADDYGTYGHVPNLSNQYLQSLQNQGRQNGMQGTAPEVIEKKDSYLRSAIGFNIGGSDSSNGATQTSTGSSSYYEAKQNTLSAGSLIPVTLLTGVDSDLPSQVVCQVRENVYDSITGDVLLIPQGAKIIGEVNNGAVGAAQERIAVAWKRMILPNGYSVNLGSMPGVDRAGYPGLKDKVNSHTGKIFGATMLTSLFSAAAQIAAGNTSSDDQSSGQLAVSGAAGNILNAGSKILERNININPTIQISPGTIFNIFVSDDLVLRPYE